MPKKNLNLNKDYLVDKKVRNLLKRHSILKYPKRIIINTYEFNYQDEYLNALLSDNITIHDLSEDVIIAGLDWYIKKWKFYPERYNVKTKKILEIDENNLKYLFVDNIIPEEISFCTSCNNPFALEMLCSKPHSYNNIC